MTHTTHPHRSHALRGNAAQDALRHEAADAERLKILFPRGAWEQWGVLQEVRV